MAAGMGIGNISFIAPMLKGEGTGNYMREQSIYQLYCPMNSNFGLDNLEGQG